MLIVRSLGVYVAGLLAALLLSTLRLRDLALAGAPLALWLPFLRPLFSAAFEASLLLAAPTAWLAGWLASGGERAITAQRVKLLLLSAGLTSMSVAGAVLTDVGSRSPGLLAQELIDTGRQSCEASPTRRVDVPLVAVAWACPANVPASISGKSSGLGGAKFRASTLRVSEDLRQFELERVELELPKKKGRLAARVSAGRARISGLPPWGRPRDVSLGLRLAFAFVGALAAVVVLVRLFGGAPRKGLALLVAPLCGAVLLLVQHKLDRAGASSAAYALLAPAGALAAVTFALFSRAILQVWSSFQARRKRATV